MLTEDDKIEIKRIADETIRQSFNEMIAGDRFVFRKDIQLERNVKLLLGTDGLNIGNSTTDKLGFYGVTPVDQPATVSDPSGGVTVDSSARTAINAIIDRLQELGLIST